MNVRYPDRMNKVPVRESPKPTITERLLEQRGRGFDESTDSGMPDNDSVMLFPRSPMTHINYHNSRVLARGIDMTIPTESSHTSAVARKIELDEEEEAFEEDANEPGILSEGSSQQTDESEKQAMTSQFEIVNESVSSIFGIVSETAESSCFPFVTEPMGSSAFPMVSETGEFSASSFLGLVSEPVMDSANSDSSFMPQISEPFQSESDISASSFMQKMSEPNFGDSDVSNSSFMPYQSEPQFLNSELSGSSVFPNQSEPFFNDSDVSASSFLQKVSEPNFFSSTLTQDSSVANISEPGYQNSSSSLFPAVSEPSQYMSSSSAAPKNKKKIIIKKRSIQLQSESSSVQPIEEPVYMESASSTVPPVNEPSNYYDSSSSIQPINEPNEYFPSLSSMIPPIDEPDFYESASSTVPPLKEPMQYFDSSSSSIRPLKDPKYHESASSAAPPLKEPHYYDSSSTIPPVKEPADYHDSSSTAPALREPTHYYDSSSSEFGKVPEPQKYMSSSSRHHKKIKNTNSSSSFFENVSEPVFDSGSSTSTSSRRGKRTKRSFSNAEISHSSIAEFVSEPNDSQSSVAPPESEPDYVDSSSGPLKSKPDAISSSSETKQRGKKVIVLKKGARGSVPLRSSGGDSSSSSARPASAPKIKAKSVKKSVRPSPKRKSTSTKAKKTVERSIVLSPTHSDSSQFDSEISEPDYRDSSVSEQMSSAHELSSSVMIPVSEPDTFESIVESSAVSEVSEPSTFDTRYEFPPDVLEIHSDAPPKLATFSESDALQTDNEPSPARQQIDAFVPFANDSDILKDHELLVDLGLVDSTEPQLLSDAEEEPEEDERDQSSLLISDHIQNETPEEEEERDASSILISEPIQEEEEIIERNIQLLLSSSPCIIDEEEAILDEPLLSSENDDVTEDLSYISMDKDDPVTTGEFHPFNQHPSSPPLPPIPEMDEIIPSCDDMSTSDGGLALQTGENVHSEEFEPFSTVSEIDTKDDIMISDGSMLNSTSEGGISALNTVEDQVDEQDFMPFSSVSEAESSVSEPPQKPDLKAPEQEEIIRPYDQAGAITVPIEAIFNEAEDFAQMSSASEVLESDGTMTDNDSISQLPDGQSTIDTDDFNQYHPSPVRKLPPKIPLLSDADDDIIDGDDVIDGDGEEEFEEEEMVDEQPDIKERAIDLSEDDEGEPISLIPDGESIIDSDAFAPFPRQAASDDEDSQSNISMSIDLSQMEDGSSIVGTSEFEPFKNNMESTSITGEDDLVVSQGFSGHSLTNASSMSTKDDLVIEGDFEPFSTLDESIATMSEAEILPPRRKDPSISLTGTSEFTMNSMNTADSVISSNQFQPFSTVEEATTQDLVPPRKITDKLDSQSGATDFTLNSMTTREEGITSGQFEPWSDLQELSTDQSSDSSATFEAGNSQESSPRKLRKKVRVPKKPAEESSSSNPGPTKIRVKVPKHADKEHESNSEKEESGHSGIRKRVRVPK